MSMHTSYGQFMADVINRADQLSMRRGKGTLAEKYNSPATISKMLMAVANSGWPAYKALAGFLAHSTALGLAAGIALFIISPLGLVVVGALAYWGGRDSIKLLFQNKPMVEDVKSVGDRFKTRYDACTTDMQREQLLDEAANDLLRIR